MHTIHEKKSKAGAIWINRQSQLLTTNDYMRLLIEQEKMKKEVKEIKSRKRQQNEEKRATKIVVEKLNENARIEKEIL